jgi:ParB-like chromosome segregation protein Spo0J
MSKKISVSSPVVELLPWIEHWPVDQPVAYARNARKIPQKAVDKVAASLQEFGFRQPIVVDAQGVVVVGHTRLLAAKQLKLTTVPVHVARDLTKAQIQAYRIADNRTSEETDWDRELLYVEMSELAEEFVDLNSVTGFDVAEISDLLGYHEDVTAPEGDAPIKERKTILGIAIECDTESQQAELLEEFERRSLKCRALA